MKNGYVSNSLLSSSALLIVHLEKAKFKGFPSSSIRCLKYHLQFLSIDRSYHNTSISCFFLLKYFYFTSSKQFSSCWPHLNNEKSNNS